MAFAFGIAALFAAMSAAGAILDLSIGFSLGGVVDPLVGHAVVAAPAALRDGRRDGLHRHRRRRLGDRRPRAHLRGRAAARRRRSSARSSRPRSSPSRGIFVAAIQVCAPVLLALIITDVAIGVVSKVVPQLNVFAVGFPAKIAVGLLLDRRLAAVRGRLAQRTSSSARSPPPSSRSRWRGVMASGGDSTEKATPKKRDDARKKGQVARSMDLNGAIVLLAALFALSAFAPRMLQRIMDATRELLLLVAQPDVVGREGIGERAHGGRQRLAALRSRRSPRSAWSPACWPRSARSASSPRRRPSSRTPRSSTRSPGAKMIFGTHALFEGAKSIVKVVAVGAIAALALLPKLDELAALVGMPPAVLLPEIANDGARHRPARRRRLPRHRRRRRRLPALAPREGPQDGQAGGQGRVQAAAAAGRGQGRAAPPGDGARPRAHDGRGPDRRRRRHQPDALLRRPALLRRRARAGRGRQGPGPRRPPHPRARAARPASPSSPTRRSPARSTPRSTSGA